MFRKYFHELLFIPCINVLTDDKFISDDLVEMTEASYLLGGSFIGSQEKPSLVSWRF